MTTTPGPLTPQQPPTTTGPILTTEAKQKILDKLNTKNTAWAALAVGVVTIWNTPGLKEQFATLIQTPTVQNLSVLVGAVVTAALLYVSKPAGVS